MAITGKGLLRTSPTVRASRDVWTALSIKLALLALLYLLFFSPSHRPPSDAVATAGALIPADPK
jgi:hypothetical protein